MDGNSIEKGKRVYVRVEVNCLVQYSSIVSRNDKDIKTVNAVNISEGGLLFKGYEELPVSSTVKLKINLMSGQKAVETFAKVVHCSKGTHLDAETIYYRIGVSFMDLSETDRSAIRAYVADAMKDKVGRSLIRKTYWWQFWKIRKREAVDGTSDSFFTLEMKKRRK